MAFEEYQQLSDGAWVIDPAEFKEAFIFVTQVYRDSDDFDLSRYQLEIEDPDGTIRKMDIEDTPINRVLTALRDWYHEEPVEKFISISWRIIALSQLIKTGALSQWVKNSPEENNLVIPGVIILVAATLPLNQAEGFDPDLFIQTVLEILPSGA